MKTDPIDQPDTSLEKEVHRHGIPAYYLHARDFYVKALRDAGLTEKEIDSWEYEYLKSLDDGVQLNFFPQFYAIGTKPKS